MRDILEDAEGAVDRGEIGPGKANRGRDRQVFPERFYKEVAHQPQDGGHGVFLDGKPLRTPGRQPLVLPTGEAAELLTGEWSAVEDEINPLLMPVTRLANTAVDGVSGEMQAVMEDILRYSGSDLLCYRADAPEGLVERQQTHWDPVLDWALESLKARFETVSGIMHLAQPKEAVAALGATLESHRDPFRLACIHTWTSLSGSAILAVALAEGEIDVATCWAAAHVDEDWNISQWGEDYEAAARRQQRWKDFEAAHRLFTSLG